MRFRRLLECLAPTILGAVTLPAQPAAPQRTQYAPISEYLMARDAEIALARSAAPAGVSGHATLEVLTSSGYQVAHTGDNGFVCLVMRGWAAPTFTPVPFRAFVYDAAIRAPICYDATAARTVLPYQKLRAQLGMAGRDPAAIAAGVQAAYATGVLPHMETVAFAYMFSADQYLGAGIGAFHPHVMVFTPYRDNATLGGNAFGGPYPFVSDDAGTPFAVTVIPIDHALAIHTTDRGGQP